MRILYFQVNAFTHGAFTGNPAGVCPLDSWLPDTVLQRIASENNLSETAFFVRENDGWRLRWMTPALEVDLCGHATLATAHVLFFEMGERASSLQFHTRSGLLSVARNADLLELDFPARRPLACEPPETLIRALGAKPTETLKSRDYVAVFETEADIASVQPDLELVAQLDSLGLIITAPGTNCDFVSRFFAPQAGVNEDPVTGSAHCSLIPYWSGRLRKTELRARQISKRGGELFCRDLGQRVGIAGKAEVYLRGEVQLPASAGVG